MAVSLVRLCHFFFVLELMGWEPKYSPQEGLAETVVWMRDKLDRAERFGVGPRYLIDTILKRIKRGVIFDLKTPILAPK